MVLGGLQCGGGVVLGADFFSVVVVRRGLWCDGDDGVVGMVVMTTTCWWCRWKL